MVESTALEMRRAGNGTQGSNPCLSAKFLMLKFATLVKRSVCEIGLRFLFGPIMICYFFQCIRDQHQQRD